MTKKEFVAEVVSSAEKHRKKYPCLRKGQAIFNYVDENYGPVARQVQFEDGIDCFYDDSRINAFLDACFKRIDLIFNFKPNE